MTRVLERWLVVVSLSDRCGIARWCLSLALGGAAARFASAGSGTRKAGGVPRAALSRGVGPWRYGLPAENGMRDGDVTPIVDADTVRRAIASAQDEVCGALRCVASASGPQARPGSACMSATEARTLDELGLQASELHAVQAASSDAQLLKRAAELKSRADEIIRRVGELQAFALKPARLRHCQRSR